MMIKVFLIASVLAVTAYLVRGGTTGRHLALRRLVSVGFAGSWVVAVLAPDVVTRAANLVGVGRGTDLVLYVLVVAYLFSAVSMRQHLRETEDRIAQLVRELALLRATEALGAAPGATEPGDQQTDDAT